MKIIDILNKKANRTLEDGFEFRFKHFYYKYHKANDSFYNCESRNIFGDEFRIDERLNEEVDVIEENKEIKEVENISYNFTKTSYTGIELSKNFETITELLNKQSDKLNELVRAYNKLIKESEEK